MAGQVQEIQHSLGVDFYEVVPPAGKEPSAWIIAFWSETEDTKKARFSNRDEAAAFMGAVHDAILKTYRERTRGVVK